MHKAKTVLMLAAVLLSLFSCAEKNLMGPESKEPEKQEAESYEYRFALDESGTKASLSNSGVYWENEDHVGLFLGGASSVAADVDVNTTPKSIVYSSGSPLPEGTYVYAYYPYRTGNTDVSAAQILFPATQQGGSVSAMPMAGVPFQIQAGDNGTKGAVHFLNLGSVIDFQVYSASYAGESIQSVTLTATSGDHPVCGEATLDLTNVENSLALTWPLSPTSSSSVTLTQAGTVAATKVAAALTPMYMVVAPGTYSGIISILTDKATYTLPFNSHEFKRNALWHVGVNLEGSSVTRMGGVYSIENEMLAAYLNDVEANPYNPADYSYTYMSSTYSGGNTLPANRLDWPKPVPVSWTNPPSGNASKVVYIYNDSAREKLELSVNASSSVTQAEVYNLIPGRTYYYSVKNDGTEIARGSFRTTGRRRMIKVGDSPRGAGYANNCRDIGGQKTADGQIIKYGKIYRGTNMDQTTDVQKDFLLNHMHVALDVDLRGGSELNDALELGDMHTTQTYSSWGELSNPASMSATLTKIFDAVAANKVPYIHCAGGADRTGYVCMLLEALLGVTQGACDVDYELTSFSGTFSGTYNPRLRLRTGVNNGYYRTVNTSVRGVDFINTFSGTTFQDKAVNYVTNTLGIPMDKITAFQNNMLEESYAVDSSMQVGNVELGEEDW